jgi:hypothetical protein
MRDEVDCCWWLLFTAVVALAAMMSVIDGGGIPVCWNNGILKRTLIS